ncbi:MAG: heme d1 biosynthesis radical SAM protein NirJ [marine bacterium B5-7]|nr:MAG: heme d1 biosynthesis radical SAM protein NirJ [marine bacterium B5-7]
MFRLSRYLRAIEADASSRPTIAVKPDVPRYKPSGPVVIWNLIRRCNLTCTHCYATSADRDFEGELSLDEINTVMDDLKGYGVPVLILSGGEPMMHPHILDIAARAKGMGFYVGLSSNGTLFNKENIAEIAALDLDYVGISIDGMREIHDRFRRRVGAFDEALRGVRLCHDAGIRVGLRFTLTRDNHADLPSLLKLMRDEKVDKFYLSHLNYAGRGNRNRARDAQVKMTRDAIDLLIETCLDDIRSGRHSEFVTGNNDADGVYLLHWVRRSMPDQATRLEDILRRWGGNSSGVNIANIDNLGMVHPDTMWWDYSLGGVRERPFSEIWEDTRDPLMRGLKSKSRPLEGRCAVCTHLDICGGNSRTRAWQLTGNPWAEDPGCYLHDDEIGVSEMPPRIDVTPYSKLRNRAVVGVRFGR